MKVVTRHLLKFLPIDEVVRQETLAKLDSYTPDQKLALSRFCWMMFYELFYADVKYEFNRALVDVKDGKRSLEAHLYQKIEDQVYQKFMRDIRDEQEADTIDQTRLELKKIMAEKMASLTTKKAD